MRLPKPSLLAGTVLLTLMVGGAVAQRPKKPAIWFQPLDDRPRLINGVWQKERQHPDFRATMTATSGWEQAASRTRALLFAPIFIDTAPDDELAQVAAFATAHNMGIWIALQAAYVTSPCGQRTEGIIHNLRQTTGLIERMAKLRFPVAGFAFDEPFNNASSMPDRPGLGIMACHYIADQTAQALVPVTRAIEAAYPHAQIIDIEAPTFQMIAAQALIVIPTWMDAYQRATGRKFDGLALDTYYTVPGWQQVVSGLTTYLHAHGQRALIYALSPGGPKVTDESWLAGARADVDAIHASGIPIDVIIVASWQGHPAGNLPETGGGITSIIDYIERVWG